MNFKGLTTLHLTAALFAGALFLGDAAASTPSARRLARQVSVDASQIYRTADRHARRFSAREDRALSNLRDLQFAAQDLEMDMNRARPARTQRSFDQLERATREASRTIVNLSAYRMIDRQFRNLEMDVNQLKREIRRGGGGQNPGQLRGVKRLANRYQSDIRSLIQSIRSQIRPRGQRGPRVQQKMRALRQLKQEAELFLTVAQSAPRVRRVKRAFESLAASHRATRMEVQPLLRRTGTGMYMRQASQTLREMGQKLDRVGGGHGPIGGGFQDDFGSYPRF